MIIELAPPHYTKKQQGKRAKLVIDPGIGAKVLVAVGFSGGLRCLLDWKEDYLHRVDYCLL